MDFKGFKIWLEERQGGRTLPETGYEYSTAAIYRAVLATEQYFKPDDYVTRSKKWAVEHAEHVAAVEGQPAIVLQANVPAEYVVEAYNPGEYFYKGPQTAGQKVYITSM